MVLFRMLKGDKSLNRHLKGASTLSALNKPTHQTRYGHLTILKMLGLYLYSIIIGHKSCNMLSILNKLTL